MGLEILGSRVMAPSYGSSVYVWGSLITTFLAALALGYWLGGRAADRFPSIALFSTILSIASVLILPAVVWASRILEMLGGAGWDVRLACLGAALLLFLLPSVAMGMVSPFAIRIAIRQVESAGSVSGGYFALSTAGSIVGTLGMTFLLIPSFPVNALLVGLAATLAGCAALTARGRLSFVAAATAGAACIAAGLAAASPQPAEGQKVLLRRDTPYHHILVTEIGTTRYLRFDNLTQSAVDLARPERSVLAYDQELLLAFALRPSIRRVCMIGLGGGSLARAITRLRPEAEIDTVEIDPAVREIAVRYFLYRESDRVRTTIQDGRLFLSTSPQRYDLIVLDAFNSTGVPFHLLTREFFEIVRSRLTPEGLLAANFIGSLMGENARLFWAAYRTIRSRLGQVYVGNAEIAAGGTAPYGNILVYATASADPADLEVLRHNARELAARWRLPGLPQAAEVLRHSPEPPAGTRELTDALAPVEALQSF